MDIFGLTPVQAAIILPLAGIALSNILGWLDSGKKFNVKLSVKSGILAIFTTIPVAIVALQALPSNLSDLETLAFVATFVGQAAGFDHIGKKANSIRKASKANANSATPDS